MAITLLYGCCQIETCTRDLAATRDFFRRALGANPIEQELARQIDGIAPGTAYGCDHIGLGKAVFQVNQPDPAMVFNGHPSVHQAYLDRMGPCVTNLNFFIDDHLHARELLTAMGAPVHIEGPSTAVAALGDYGPDNTRPGGKARPFLFLGTRSLIGLDLEIMEPNFRRFSEQRVQFPAFMEPRPNDEGDLLRLERLVIVVADLEAILANLTRMLTPACRSKPYACAAGPAGRGFRIGFGGIEIEYVQPCGGKGELAQFLERDGPGVIAIEFASRNLAASLEMCRPFASAAPFADWIGRRVSDEAFRLASRDTTGFDAILRQDAAVLSDQSRCVSN